MEKINQDNRRGQKLYLFYLYNKLCKKTHLNYKISETQKYSLML